MTNLETRSNPEKKETKGRLGWRKLMTIGFWITGSIFFDYVASTFAGGVAGNPSAFSKTWVSQQEHVQAQIYRENARAFQNLSIIPENINYKKKLITLYEENRDKARQLSGLE